MSSAHVKAACVVVLSTPRPLPSSASATTTSSSSSVLSETSSSSSPRYYSLLIISRGNTSSLWSLPGGKQENNEDDSGKNDNHDIKRTAQRELREETGIQAEEDELIELMEDDVYVKKKRERGNEGNSDETVKVFRTTCFLLGRTIKKEDIQEGFYSTEGFVRWTDDFDDLTERSPFKNFNEKLQRVLCGKNIYIGTENVSKLKEIDCNTDDKNRSESHGSRVSKTIRSEYDYMKIQAYVNI